MPVTPRMDNCERLYRDSAAEPAKVVACLGLAPAELFVGMAERNPGHYDRGNYGREPARLKEYFAPHNRKLLEFLSEGFDW